MSKTLTLLLMDPPFESANTTTAFRLIEAALRKGHTVNVFAYEGAVNLTMKGQQPHANPVHGKSVEGENHSLSRDIVAGLFAEAHGDRLRWTNCGLCVEDR
jgi:tRNA 2-thiouridine synthesizing protein D